MMLQAIKIFFLPMMSAILGTIVTATVMPMKYMEPIKLVLAGSTQYKSSYSTQLLRDSFEL